LGEARVCRADAGDVVEYLGGVEDVDAWRGRDHVGYHVAGLGRDRGAGHVGHYAAGADGLQGRAEQVALEGGELLEVGFRLAPAGLGAAAQRA
jgi:hypothetical protein